VDLRGLGDEVRKERRGFTSEPMKSPMHKSAPKGPFFLFTRVRECVCGGGEMCVCVRVSEHAWVHDMTEQREEREEEQTPNGRSSRTYVAQCA
jgi:hypothetical protein